MKKMCIVALALAGLSGCEFGPGYEEPAMTSVTGQIEWTQEGLESSETPVVDLSDPAGNSRTRGEVRARMDSPADHPGDCLDLSTGVLLIVPCLTSDAHTGDKSHGDPQPWHPVAPAPVPQPY